MRRGDIAPLWLALVLSGCGGEAPQAQTSVVAAAPGGLDEDPHACGQRRKVAREVIARTLVLSRACHSSRDCTAMDLSTSCEGSCQAAVSKSGAPAVHEELGRLDGTLCAHFRADGCLYATPVCRQFVPVCHEGRCESAYVALPEAPAAD